MKNYFDYIQHKTEKYLTWRNIRKHRKEEKQKVKNPVLDWVEAFLWAAMVVLLVNQYFFQAYQIPSGSMMNTLLVSDRIFVNKFIYGPEFIPGILKMPGFFNPERGEVVIFESPTYLTRGPVFDITQRILYMLTLSLVDIDKDEYGEPKPHFLIKRASGIEYDRIRINNGFLQIRPEGTQNWVYEKDFEQYRREEAKVRRLLTPDDYTTYKDAAYATALNDYNIVISSKLETALRSMNTSYTDTISFNKYRLEMLYSIEPFNRNYRKNWRKQETGWYIPEGWIFPLGDNRDNSRDARYFGPVRLKKVLGKAMFKYWPAGRIGIIK